MPVTASAPLTKSDVVLTVTMTGLKHCWLIQGGRSGEYFTAVVVRTDDTGEIEEPCHRDGPMLDTLGPCGQAA
jgi:hypothetical protein